MSSKKGNAHRTGPSAVKQEAADHGESYMPGAGPEDAAPQSLDHFRRGYQERALMRAKEELMEGEAGPDYERNKNHRASSPVPPENHSESNKHQKVSNRSGDGNQHNQGSFNSGGGNGGNSRHFDRNNHNNYNGSSSNNERRSDHYSRGPPPDRYPDFNRGDGRNSSFPGDVLGRKERVEILHGLDVAALLDRLSHPRANVYAELDLVRKSHPEAFECGKAMTAAISGAARRRQLRLAQVCWDYMDERSIEKNVFHYNSMISVAEKTRDHRMALDLMDEMTRRKIEKNEVTFSSAISACEKCGQWRFALDLLDAMEKEGAGRTAIAYNAAISACEKGLVPQKACDVFQRMKRIGVAPSVVSYSALISAAEKGGQWKLALEILEEMKQAGFHGNVVAYSAAISALAKGQQWEKALELFREIQACGGSPSIVTYNATMTALEKGIQWERALGLFEEMKMKNMPITVVSYGSAISACDKGFQYRQCLEFLDEMTEMGIKKNVIIFGAAMSCMEKCCRADISFQLMERMKMEGILPNVHIYNSAISACARCGMWEKGHELFKEMDEMGIAHDVVSYNAVLDAVASQIDLGRKLFEDGVKKGFYARVSRLGNQWFELDLHFLSLGGGEIALGWWFEECLVPFLMDISKLAKVSSISIVTGYGKTRTRGRRIGDDGMKKRVLAMLRHMDIYELPQNNAGRIHIDKDRLIDTVKKNNGRVVFDLERYIEWKERETTANVIPDVPQKIRARFRPVTPGSGRPPFERIETESTSTEYKLENMRGEERFNSRDEGRDSRLRHDDRGSRFNNYQRHGYENNRSQDNRFADDYKTRHDSRYQKPSNDSNGSFEGRDRGRFSQPNGDNHSKYGNSRDASRVDNNNRGPNQGYNNAGRSFNRQSNNQDNERGFDARYRRGHDDTRQTTAQEGRGTTKSDVNGRDYYGDPSGNSPSTSVGVEKRKRNFDDHQIQQPRRGYSLEPQTKRRQS